MFARLKDFSERLRGLVVRQPVNLPHFSPPSCEYCSDTGWRLCRVEAKGRVFDAVVRCACREPHPDGPILETGETVAARIAALGKASK